MNRHEGESMKKSTSKESIRLWFEFLKRASSDPKITVNKEFYEPWGDYSNQTFNIWWEQHAQPLFERKTIELAERHVNDGEHLHLKVPMSMTPTEAANKVRELLIDHYQSIGHVPRSSYSYSLTDGVEIRISAFRAYLHTYDINQKLKLARPQEDSVTAKELLAEVRRFYLMRTNRWKNSKRTVEGLPMALAGDFSFDSETKTITNPKHDVTGIRNIRRYLHIAQRLVEAAAIGDFPGREFNK